MAGHYSHYRQVSVLDIMLIGLIMVLICDYLCTVLYLLQLVYGVISAP